LSRHGATGGRLVGRRNGYVVGVSHLVPRQGHPAREGGSQSHGTGRPVSRVAEREGAPSPREGIPPFPGPWRLAATKTPCETPRDSRGCERWQGEELTTQR